MRVGPPSAAVEELDVNGDLVLFSGTTNRAFVLNITAADTWLLSDGSYDEDGLVDALARAYDVDPEMIRVDVIGLLASFRDEGLLP